MIVNAAFARTSANARYWIAIAALVGSIAMPIISALPSRGIATTAVAVPADLEAGTAAAITIAYLALVAVAGIRLARRWWLARKLTSDTIATPVTIGVLRPVILLPRFLTDPELVAAAVAHETAHVRRRDYLVQLLTEIASLPLAFHPAIVLLKRRIGELREMACDESAATDRPAYARALVEIASLATRHTPAGALAMATSSIERRIASLRVQSPRSTATLAIATFAFVATLLFVTGCRYAAHPSVGANLSGDWTLDRAASTLGPLRAYTAFRQSIRHDGNHVAVKQTRFTSRGVERVNWAVTTDGVERPVDARGTGSARWQDQRLVLEMHDPGHSEHASAWVDDDTLTIEGETRGKRGVSTYRAVFRRTR
jgi:hypothetical protein